jgi:hypothetical protein
VSVYEELFALLSSGGVRYVVVGGVAVVLQGYPRLTADIDLVIDLDPVNIGRAVDLLTEWGLKPLLPVPPRDFANPAKRQEWIETKNLEVFSMRDERNPIRTVDLFAREPIPFDELWTRADRIELGGHEVRVASIPDLIRMKRMANRTQDLLDIEKLEAIASKRKS